MFFYIAVLSPKGIETAKNRANRGIVSARNGDTILQTVLLVETARGDARPPIDGVVFAWRARLCRAAKGLNDLLNGSGPIKRFIRWRETSSVRHLCGCRFFRAVRVFRCL